MSSDQNDIRNLQEKIQAAKKLGIGRNTLTRKLKDLQMLDLDFITFQQPNGI